MSEEIEYRVYQDTDFSQIVPLLDKVFHGWPKHNLNCSKEDFYRWKYLDIYKDLNKSVVAEKNGKIIGVSHEYHHKIKLFDEIVSACNGSDVATDPDFRGSGVWSNLIKYWNEEINPKRDFQIMQYLTGNPIIVKRLQNVRATLPHTLTNLVWIKDIDLHLEKIPMDNNFVVKTGFNTLKTFNNIQNIFRQRQHTPQDSTIQTVDSFDQKIQPFWDKVSKEYDFITLRDQEYLNWRYADPRSGKFTIKSSQDKEGNLTGFIVYTINDKIPRYPVGFICDLLTVPDSPETYNLLLNEAMNNFLVNNVNIVNYLLVKNHPYTKQANSFGFLDSRIKLHIFLSVNKHKERFDKLKNTPPERIYFSWGDHDSQPLGVKRTSD